MANDSTTAGYLAPTGTVVADDALEDIFTGMVVGIAGIAAGLVRPRWQTNPPPIPAASVNWCAIGITTTTPDANAAISHSPGLDGEGIDNLLRHEDIEVMASFYGPQGQANGLRLRDGLQIAQNRDTLALAGVSFVSAGILRNAPDLANQQWIRRYDLLLTFRRAVARTYNIRNLQSADGNVSDGSTSVDFAVTDGQP
ncbi:phage neck terminator protein [Rhodanobacter fulvus]|nr:hypothetical protein [Rhodanobacter fulvus]